MPPPRAEDSCAECRQRPLQLFCSLSLEATRRLDEIGEPLALPGRAILFEESQASDRVFVVCQGLLKLSAASRDGRVMILRLAGSGELLGLSAVLNAQRYELTAETLEPTLLKSIGRSDFLAFLHAFGEVGEKTSRVLARECREVFLDARRLALSASASGRLARLLLDWAEAANCGRAELRFTMALTHEELANMAGTARETVTRLLNQFEREGLIARHGASLLLLRPADLRRLAG
jgi:CRP/FNR family transcriptional regulator